ncbi:MAG: rhomboid family intramembrane serine protease [Pseudomonadota bacterium]
MTSRLTRIAPGSPPANAPVHPVLWVIAGSWAAIELLLNLADAGYGPPQMQRHVVYWTYGFNDRVFEFARSGNGVPTQLLVGTVTHAFLHGGWLHLALNGAAFLGLGHAISRDAGIWPTVAIFLLTAAAGALTFGLVATSYVPLVGASGAVFGLLGTLTAWQERWLAEQGASRQPIWMRVAGVIAINVVMAFGFGGFAIAWQAHLGGFAAGWLLAYAFPPRLRERRARARFL